MKVMDYAVFSRLYEEGGEYSDFDMFLGERGWQEWMSEYSPEEITYLLETIYNLSKLDFVGMREVVGVSRAEMSRLYRIPLRTLESWEIGTKETPFYRKGLYAYTIFNHMLRRGQGGAQ